MNKCQFSGRTTAEPELRFLTDGKPVCNFTLAVRRDFKNKAGEYESDFLNCVAYGKTGELIAEYVKKGALFPVWGKIQIRNYNDKDGVKHWMTEIIIEGFDFPPKGNSNSSESPNNSTGTNSFGHEVSLDDDPDSIPF